MKFTNKKKLVFKGDRFFIFEKVFRRLSFNPNMDSNSNESTNQMQQLITGLLFVV
jgi:hypothetical protein